MASKVDHRNFPRNKLAIRFGVPHWFLEQRHKTNGLDNLTHCRQRSYYTLQLDDYGRRQRHQRDIDRCTAREGAQEEGLSLRLCNGVHTDVTHKDAKLYVWAVCGVYLTKVVFNHLSCSGLKT